MLKKWIITGTVLSMLCVSSLGYAAISVNTAGANGSGCALSEKTIEIMVQTAKKHGIQTENKTNKQIIEELYEQQKDRRTEVASKLGIKTNDLNDEQISESIINTLETNISKTTSLEKGISASKKSAVKADSSLYIQKSAEKYNIKADSKNTKKMLNELYAKQHEKRIALAAKLGINTEGMNDKEVTEALLQDFRRVSLDSSINETAVKTMSTAETYAVFQTDSYGWYEYVYWDNDQHMVYYIDPDDLEDPTTVIGLEPCTYFMSGNLEWQCLYCGHTTTSSPRTWYEYSYWGDGQHMAYYIDLDYLEDPMTVLGLEYCDCVISNGWMECPLCGYPCLDDYSTTKAIWQMDGNVNDATGQGNDGTLMNGTTFSSGCVNQALNLNGTNNYVQIPSYTNFNNMSSFTLTAWIYPTAYKSSNPIITKAVPNRDFVLQLDSAGKPQFHIAHGATYYHCYSNQAAPLNTWSHVAAIVTPTKITLYMNGNPIGERALSNISPLWTGTDMEIGGFIQSYFFSGKLDDVKIFDTALTQNQLSSEYNYHSAIIPSY